jgi:outer membrane protein assembly factor BamB
MYYMTPTAAPFYGMTPAWIEYNKGTSAEVQGAGEINTVTATLKTISGSQMYVINPTTGTFSSNITLGNLTATQRYGDWALMLQDLGSGAANATGGRYRLINWTTRGTTTNWASRIISNISNLDFTSFAAGGVDLANGINVAQSRFTIGSIGGGRLRGYSLVSGKLLWDRNFTDSPFNPGTNCADDGKYFCVFENAIVRGFDAFTGNTLWETETDYPWGEFWTYYVASGPVDNSDPKAGIFVADSYAGTYAFNWSNGDIVWRSSHMAPPFETPYSINGTAGTSTYPGTGTPIIVDGMVYIQSSEHTQTAPYARGFGTYCINATTGELKWSLDEPCVLGAAADGYSVMTSQYGGFTYFLGKGKSAMTVSAPGSGVKVGESVAITGTITDLSAAQPGTPCISEKDMGAYMSHLHMQSQIQNMLHPDVPTGVPISIDAIDPEGGFVHIADATSDMTSFFSTAWKPDKVGLYVITASFNGSPSYGSSYAETAIVVDPAPAEIEMPQIPTPTDYSQQLNMILAAVVVAIILAVVAIALVLRKR